MDLVKKFAKDHKEHEVTKQQGNFSSLVWGTSALLMRSPFYSQYYPEDFGSIAFLSKERRGAGFFSMDGYIMSTEMSLQKYIISPAKFPAIKDYDQLIVQIDEMYKSSYLEKLSKMSDSDLEKVINQSFQKITDWQVITLFCEALDDNLVEKYYIDIKGDRVGYEDFFKYSSAVSFEPFVSKTGEMLTHFDSKTDPYRVQWILASYLIAPPLNNVADLIDKEIDGRGGVDEIRAQQNAVTAEAKENKKQADEYYNNLDDKLKNLFKFVQYAIDLRDTRKEFMFKAITVLSNSVREMYSRIGLDEEDVIHAFLPDFSNGAYRDADYKEKIAHRKNGFIIYADKGDYKTEYIDYDKTKNELFKIMDKDATATTEIMGNVGNRGHVTAKVNIVLSEKDFSKFKKGDILVTSMTRPEFVPLMKMASAVVTDEGGITCHAAIVSRELNLPCIIGTKNATRVLKDGDEVEVDAKRGIVTVIKKK